MMTVIAPVRWRPKAQPAPKETTPSAPKKRTRR